MEDVKSKADMLVAAVGENLFNYRQAMDISEALVAEMVGLPVETIGEIEAGRIDVSLITLAKLAIVYHTALSDLVDVAGSEMGLASPDRR